MKDDLKERWDEYGAWLVSRVGFNNPAYGILMKCLHTTPFTYDSERFYLDRDRVSDGQNLRREAGVSDIFGPAVNCSMLELMVALSIRLDNEYIGDMFEEHPEIIFWEMICNLGLDDLADYRWDSRIYNAIIQRFLDRKITDKGVGSLFRLKKSRQKFAQLTIWEQSMAYIFDKIRQK